MKDTATVFSVTPNTCLQPRLLNAVGVFVQDNFKLNSRLTLEYGLRFEWNGTPVEGANRFVVFNPLP